MKTFKIYDRVQISNDWKHWDNGYVYLTEYMTEFDNIDNELYYVVWKDFSYVTVKYCRKHEKVEISKDMIWYKVGIHFDDLIIKE